jgi:serine protease
MKERRNQILRCLRFVVMVIVLWLAVTACGLFNQPPTPSIVIAEGSSYGQAPLTVTIDISASSDADGTITSFIFDFGDGTDPIEGTDLDEQLEHTYVDPGSYAAKLTVLDNGGKSSSLTLAIVVSSA